MRHKTSSAYGSMKRPRVTIQDINVRTQAGTGHGYPTVTVIGYALPSTRPEAEQSPSGGPAPQVLIERYQLSMD